MFNDNLLELDARKEIYDCIRKSPGLHFREIQRRTKLPTGSVEYHLHFLHKNGLVRAEKKGKFLYYYPTDHAFGEEEKILISLLRQKNIRHILMSLIEKKGSTPSELGEKLGMSPSNLSWYLNMLSEKNIITQKKRGRFRHYSVRDKKRIVLCLVTYRASFLDKTVDGFIEAFE
ncbi:MAG: winged helix-turn-helix transcriptional regulator [Candidatus Aenigmarchaeota archaeon]|nr:winged helix-turn-helix transcriptional regulator [Candidatus Aenigmarchaeota archaeon]